MLFSIDSWKCPSALEKTIGLEHKSWSSREVWTHLRSICHTAPWTKSPNFEVLPYLDKFSFSFGGELHHEPTILFPDMLCGGSKAKCRPERRAQAWTMSAVEWQAIPCTLQHGELGSSQAKLRRSPDRWQWLFPRRSAPKWRETAYNSDKQGHFRPWLCLLIPLPTKKLEKT